MTKRLSAQQQLLELEASGVDYALLAIACFIPIWYSGDSLQMRTTGLVMGLACVFGIFVSFLIRRRVQNAKLLKAAVYPQVVMAVLIAINILRLNALLPDGGFPWQLMNTAYLSFLLVGCSVFIWSDGTIFFQIVPGVALFGILSWLETGLLFQVWLIVFMASVAVLLTRLHTRTMVAMAFAAGSTDVDELRRTSWKSMAGPVLAIISVVVIALTSAYIYKPVGNTLRNALGNPEIRINLRPPSTGAGIGQEPVDQRIGLGPSTASNLPLLRVTAPPGVTLLRRKQFLFYRGTGWVGAPGAAIEALRPAAIPPQSGIPNANVYELTLPVELVNPIEVITVAESLNRLHQYAPLAGYPQRIEYDDVVKLQRRDILIEDSLPKGKKIWTKSFVSRPSPDELRAVKVKDRGAQLAANRRDDNNRWPARVIQLAKSIYTKYDNDYDRVMAMAHEIANRCKYNLKAERITGDVDRVETFLFETKEGYCDLFASSLALMCRTQGMQARMVTGYWLDPNSMEDGTYIVRDRHVHAWTEVFFEGYGFVPFDATEFAEAVPGGGVGDVLQDDGGGLSATMALYIAAGVVGLLSLLYVGSQVLYWYRTTRTLPSQLRKLQPAYRQFIKVLRARTGRPRAQSETIREYVDAFCHAAGETPAARDICDGLERVLYLPNETGYAEAEKLSLAVKQFILEYGRRPKQT